MQIILCLPCCHNSLNTAMVNPTKQTKAKAQTASFCCCCYFLLEIFCSFGVDSLVIANNAVNHIVWIISGNLVKCSLILNSLVKISEDKKLWIKWRLQAIIIWYILRLVPWYWNVATPTKPLKNITSLQWYVQTSKSKCHSAFSLWLLKWLQSVSSICLC